MARGFPGGMAEVFRQAQKQFSQLQQELKERVYEGSAGGVVTAHVNGHRELLGVKISPEVVDPSEVAMLEDLVTAAISQALKKAADAYGEEMGKLTGGLAVPGLF